MAPFLPSERIDPDEAARGFGSLGETPATARTERLREAADQGARPAEPRQQHDVVSGGLDRRASAGQRRSCPRLVATRADRPAFEKALIERALGAELSHHLGYRPGATKPEDAGNHRDGASGKTVLTQDGPLRIEVHRDRAGSFAPVLIPRHERRFTGFDDKIVAMYARGTTVREILGFLAERYGTEVAPDYPIPCERMIQTRDQKVGDHAKARATLADIPFVHMRHGRPEPLI